MKKRNILLFGLSTLFLLISCGNNSNNDDNNDKKDEEDTLTVKDHLLNTLEDLYEKETATFEDEGYLTIKYLGNSVGYTQDYYDNSLINDGAIIKVPEYGIYSFDFENDVLKNPKIITVADLKLSDLTYVASDVGYYGKDANWVKKGKDEYTFVTSDTYLGVALAYMEGYSSIVNYVSSFQTTVTISEDYKTLEFTVSFEISSYNLSDEFTFIVTDIGETIDSRVDDYLTTSPTFSKKDDWTDDEKEILNDISLNKASVPYPNGTSYATTSDTYLSGSVTNFTFYDYASNDLSSTYITQLEEEGFEEDLLNEDLSEETYEYKIYGYKKKIKDAEGFKDDTYLLVQFAYVPLTALDESYKIIYPNGVFEIVVSSYANDREIEVTLDELNSFYSDFYLADEETKSLPTFTFDNYTKITLKDETQTYNDYLAAYLEELGMSSYTYAFQTYSTIKVYTESKDTATSYQSLLYTTLNQIGYTIDIESSSDGIYYASLEETELSTYYYYDINFGPEVDESGEYAGYFEMEIQFYYFSI